MATDLQQRRRNQQPTVDAELTFTSDELTELLKRASSTPQVSEHRPVSLADAIQTARELGIPEENLLAAAEGLKKEKVKRAMKRVRISRRRDAFLRFLFTMIAVSTGLALIAGLKTASIVLFAMSIPLFILGSRWAMAFLEIRDEQEVDMARVLRRR